MTERVIVNVSQSVEWSYLMYIVDSDLSYLFIVIQ